MTGLVHFAGELGITLWPGQIEVLDGWVASRRRRGLFLLGRRSGKGLMAAVAAIFNALAQDYTAALRPGERRFIVVVATRIEQAREFIRVVREVLAAAPRDHEAVQLLDEDRCTEDEVVFRHNVVIRAMPCSARSTRGLPITLLVLDEAAHMVTTDEGFAAGKRVYNALAPSTRQFGDRGYILVTTTPDFSAGVAWELHRSAVTGAADDLHLEQRPTWTMNPTITRDSLASEFAADPENARVEYGAEFREGAGAFLDPDAVNLCVARKRRMLPPVDGIEYAAAADPAFAAGGDAFGLAIAHRAGDVVVVDRVESWRGRSNPLNSDTVLDDIAELCRAYRIRSVTSDQFCVVPVTDGLRRRGIELRYQPFSNESKADVFTALKRSINVGQVELPDSEQLVAELVSLQVRRTPSGKPRIAAPAGRHDDLATVVAVVVHQLRVRPEPTYDALPISIARVGLPSWI